jgi:RNA-directed DNA polymerase
VRGYFNYYAVPGNAASLVVFRHRLLVHWWHTVRRRSQKDRISWTHTGSLNRMFSIPFPLPVSPLLIRDKNRMR